MEGRQAARKPWPVRHDETIEAQANAFLNRVDGGVVFVPRQAEDYCFARAFEIMDTEDGS